MALITNFRKVKMVTTLTIAGTRLREDHDLGV